MKNFLKRLFYFFTITLSLFLAKVFYRAKKFKVSCDINPDPMDTESTLNSKYINYGNRKMEDFRAGAFLGQLTLNMTGLSYSKDHYDLTIVIDQGLITLILPDNVNCIITTLQSEDHIIDERNKVETNKTVLLAINLKVHFGKLILKSA